MSIVSRSLSDQAFEVIRERILSARIPALAPIRQEALAEDLGISKIPLREALTRLEQSGLLRSLPNRGFFVPALSATEAEEVFALRLKLEPDAAADACLEADEARREAARSALRALESVDTGDKAGLATRNRSFHLSLVQSARHQVTAQLVERLHLLADRYVHKHLEPEGRYRRADDEHQRLLDAWLDRDTDRVRTLLRAHLQLTLDDLRVQLAAAGD
ncbi:GntR family transcriptional regulator [Marilutibacter spongiae]|uniref:GntR family transcriptional regulator n=1 Tax=Marilutibacter spongiae TaxID=2025720 RepID=A0A7W3Y490_9GAMM|nr:GntR family transcriptional regulator [Lysobacter spongiae]MBB1059143.1 GntR family transcriptional regulator [Lysobacter spongiae]